MNRRFLLLFLLLLWLPVLAFGAGNTANDSYRSARRMLEQEVYYDHRVTVYCGYAFDEHRRVCLPEGFVAPAHQGRAARVEWEHAVPAAQFGRAFRQWRDGDPVCVDRRGKAFRGRRCAEKASREYRLMQADMYNLFPAIGAVNAVRSDSRYAELPGVPSAFGLCEARTLGNRFEPPARARGILARAALYMDEEYPACRLDSRQKALFLNWSRQYPVDAWECTRTRRIEALQGNENRIIKELCAAAGLW